MHFVITGSSSGIGRALAEDLLTRGHQVWGIARSSQKELQEKFPSSFRFSRCDVADWAQVAGVAGELEAAWPCIDGLVTCAGVHGAVGPALEADPMEWSGTVRANLDGTYYAIRAFAPALKRAAARAKVVAFSGGGATKARANFSAYGVAKTGVVRLIETLAAEHAADSIDFNCVAPGAINTRLTDDVLQRGPGIVGEAEYQAALKQKNSGGASLEKAIGLVRWLLSPASDGISGRLISAPWDDWANLGQRREAIASSDLYTLRRVSPPSV